MPRARARFTQRSASRTCQPLSRRPRGWSDGQPMSIRTVLTPAFASRRRDRRPALVGLAPRAVELHAHAETRLDAGRAGDSMRGNGDAPRQNKN